jgi:uncharacterized Zn finger protein/DNA-binding transcriptional regulator YiaG
MEKRRKKGEDIQPVTIAGRTIARSFWGKGWCDHLDSLGDYSNRLPRGRTYVRNGSVCHLSIGKGRVEAVVSGSELYEVRVEIDRLKAAKWNALKRQCAGKIGSLIELLQGRLSEEILSIVTDRREGLFPLPGEICYTCDCPDWAGMCKHIAAVIYGIGARLDDRPELLFTLRGVDHDELISADTSLEAIASGGGSARSRRRSLAGQDLENVFGVELEDASEPLVKPRGKRRASKKKQKPKRVLAERKKVARKKVGSLKGRKTKVVGKAPVASPKKRVKRRVAPFKPTARSVAALRRRLGMNKSEFARAVGVSSPTIVNWESRSGALVLHAKSLAGLRRLHEREK